MRQTFNPDVGYLDEDNMRVVSIRADWGVKKPRRIPDESGELLWSSEDWQRHVWTVDPDHRLAVLKDVKNVPRVTRRVTHEDGDTNIWVTIPVSLFAGLDRDQAQDVFRLVTYDTYVWGMSEFGWPAPPPVPGGIPSHANRIPVEIRGMASAEAGRRVLADVVWDAKVPAQQLRINDQVAFDPEWQAYLRQVNPAEDHLFVVHMADPDPTGEDTFPHTLRVEPDPDTGTPLTTIETRMDASVLQSSDDADEVVLAAVEDAYRWAAERLGWPAPPS